MTESQAMSINKVQLLNGSNYQIWELKVSAILRSRKLYSVVVNDYEPLLGVPGSKEAEIREEWETKNDEAFGIIILTLSDEQAGLFIGSTKANYVWQELKRIHAGNVEDRKIDIGLELKNICMGKNETVDIYINRARSIATKSAAIGQVIAPREIVYHIVRGLNSRFETVAAVLRPQRSATLEDIQQCLREEEIRISHKYRNENNFSKPENAYKAKTWFGNQRNETGDRTCYTCGKRNHISKDCWYKRNQEKSDKNTKKYQQNYRREFNNSRKQDFQRNRENANSANAEKREDYALHASTTKQKNCQIEIEEWNLDSACTSHMTHRIDWMEDVRPDNSIIYVAEKGRSIDAEAVGTINLTTEVNESETVNVSVNDVLYVPKLRTNLLSVKSMIDKGNKVIFEGNSARIYSRDDKLIAEAFNKDNMFVLKTMKREINDDKVENCLETNELRCETTMANEINCDKELWHRRLGHLNETYMDQLVKENSARGLQFKSGKLKLCEACVMGKLSQSPFKSIDSDGTVSQLELIHMDLCGPIGIESLGGSSYFYTLVDSYSRRIFVYFLRSKDETFDMFTRFKNHYENELGRKIKAIRSDNGGEFVNEQFENFLNREGIKHQRTVPYSPQSNGVAEIANRILLDKARTLLIDSQLPTKFWAEAISTAAYLKNCTPCKFIKGKTPIEMWSGKVPSVSFLKVFGSVVYYHIPKIKRGKFDPKAKKGIFIGYSKIRKAYRVLEPETGNIVDSRSAKFDEHSRGALLLRGEDRNINHEALNYIIEDQKIINNEDTNDNALIQVDSSNGIIDDAIVQAKDVSSNIPDEIRNPPKAKKRSRKNYNVQKDDRKPFTEGVRRSERIKQKQQADLTSEHTKEPRNFNEAIESSHKEEWMNAVEDELTSMNIHHVWDIVPRPYHMKVLKCKWIFSTKRNPDGSVNKRKARLVAMGCGQRPGVDYENSFSPVVVKMESLRMLIALASQRRMKIRQYDVKTAYLHGELEEEVYMEQPEGLSVKYDTGKVCKLRKSLYGLPQSGRCWYKKMNETLEHNGLYRAESDPCVYHLRKGNKIFIMGLYVDDILIIGTDDNIIDEVMDKIQTEIKMTRIIEENVFLGIKITLKENGIELSQEKYVDKILERFDLSNCNPVSTPGIHHQDLDQHQDSLEVDERNYQEMLGSLMYLSVGTRPDISFNVSQLSQYSKRPKQIHLTALKRIFRYLKGTRNYKLKFDRDQGKLTASTDASWCSTADAKSYSGYCVKMGSSLISWKSKKQDLVALSTCESEMMAICEGTRELKWAVSLLSELNLKEYVEIPITIKTDSQSAIDWIKSVGHKYRTKHINRKYYFIRDEVMKGNIVLQHVPSISMEADVLTKNLSREQIKNCIRKLGIIGQAHNDKSNESSYA